MEEGLHDGDACARLDMHDDATTVCWIQGRGSFPDAARGAISAMELKLSIQAGYIHTAVHYAVREGAVLIDAYETRRKRVAVVRDPDGLVVEICSAKTFDPEEEPSDIEHDLGLARRTGEVQDRIKPPGDGQVEP